MVLCADGAWRRCAVLAWARLPGTGYVSGDSGRRVTWLVRLQIPGDPGRWHEHLPEHLQPAETGGEGYAGQQARNRGDSSLS